MNTVCLKTGFYRFLLRLNNCHPIFTVKARAYKPIKAGCSAKLDRCVGQVNKFPCGRPKVELQKPNNKKKKRFTSMWLNPLCKPDEQSCQFNPRFDDLYYEESDKAKRRYWQTWVSCPKLKIKKKKICEFEISKTPPVRRRDLSKKPKTAAPPCDLKLTRRYRCPLLRRKCGRKARIPPSCPSNTWPSYCKKPQAPYPAFSECLRLKPGELPLSECLCWNKPMICDVWIEWRRRLLLKKP